MPYIQPSRSDVHVNRPLTNLSVAFLQTMDGFVADRVFPNVPVQKASDRYLSYDRGMFFRDEMQIRAPGAESSGANYAIDNTPSYAVDDWALHRDIPDKLRANADEPIQLDREGTEFLTQKAMIKREKTWATNYFTTGKWTGILTGVSSAPSTNQALQWSDNASTPVEDVRTQMRNIRSLTGYEANKLVLGRATYDVLIDHPDIIGRLDRGQTTGAARANKDSLAAIWGLDEVLVMEAIENTAAEGATNSFSFIGGKSALLIYAPASPGIMVPSGGYTFSWTGFLGATSMGWRIKQFRMEWLSSDRVEIEMSYTQKLIAADLGSFFATIVA